MDTIITDYLSKLELGELQEFKNMTVVPLFTSVNDSPKYLTLKEALEEKLLSVTELSSGGSVPELKVVNKAEMPVLLLDGEELVGAKQNRVLNTTILLKKKSETVIPVSCTEQGRWSSVSEEFADSGAHLSPRIRMAKVASVTESLGASQTFESDQGEIWDGVEEMSACAGVQSPTSAMKDVYESKGNKLNEYLKAFRHVPHQKGLLVFINGEVMGFDIVSLESAYETVHAKLVKSYAMDALLEEKKNTKKLAEDNDLSWKKQDELTAKYLRESKLMKKQKAKAFLEEAVACKEKKYESIGHGWDYRFQGKAIVGSALVYRKKVIHTAFFRTSESDKAGPMSGYTRRRQYRI